MPDFSITPFDNAARRDAVVALWKTVFGYDAPHNDPKLVMDKKLAVDDGLFFVAVADGKIVGTVMAGYDGHRGWIYSLAVEPSCRRQGIGSRLVRHAEQALIARGCVKINLQVVEDNQSVTHFYSALGYSIEKRISMGKRISQNFRPE